MFSFLFNTKKDEDENMDVPANLSKIAPWISKTTECMELRLGKISPVFFFCTRQYLIFDQKT